MSHLSHIKTRMHTVEKTKKITTAMRLIAMSFYSKLERHRTLLTTYRTHVQTLTALLQSENEKVAAPKTPKEDSHPCVILCSSAKGLCGGLNNGIIKFFERSLITSKQSRPTLIAIGQKASSYLATTVHGTVIESIAEYQLSTLHTVVQTIMNHFKKSTTPYTSVTIYYTHLKSFFIQTPSKLQLLPIIPTTDAPTADLSSLSPREQENYLWEQDPKVLGEALLQQHLYSELMYTLFNNLISENAARFIAMDQSTNNAKKYLETLHLEYNKSRQSAITREIAELSSNLD